MLNSASLMCSYELLKWVGFFFIFFTFFGRRQGEESISVYSVHMQQKAERNEILNMTGGPLDRLHKIE